MRILNIAAGFLALSSAFLLYALNYDTRLMEARVQAEAHRLEVLRGDVAVLKAERAHLARPERIAPLAASQGLAPAQAGQFRGWETGSLKSGN